MTKVNIPQLEKHWLQVLKEEFCKDYFSELKAFLIDEKKNYQVYPPGNLMFSAFNLTPFHDVKVVILGQDPYHGTGQAHGLCFSVPEGVKPPPSLKNIFKELHDDLQITIPQSGNLESWARQGVLLLNATLSVRKNQAGSHQGKGWERFTDVAIKALSEKRNKLVFILWGRYAQQKEILIDPSKHLILKSAHPSPFSASNGFFGCSHFSKTNEFLESNSSKPINWNLS